MSNDKQIWRPVYRKGDPRTVPSANEIAQTAVWAKGLYPRKCEFIADEEGNVGIADPTDKLAWAPDIEAELVNP